MESLNTTSASKVTDQQKGFLINRNYTFLFFGQFISLIGDQVFDITLAIWVGTVLAHGQSWAPIAVSGALIAAYVPAFLIGPLAGVFVDRWNYRRTMLRMDSIRALLVALLLPLTGIVPLGLPHSLTFQLVSVYLVIFLVNTCAQFFNPSRFALIGVVVSETDRPKASGLGQVSLALSVIIGPPLAAPLLFSIGFQWALVIDILTFLVSLIAISFISAPEQLQKTAASSSFAQEFIEGVRYVFTNATLRIMLIAAFLTVVGAGTFDALFLFFVTKNLHVSVADIGYLPAAVGFGVLIGAIVAGSLGNAIGLTRLAKIALWLSSIIFVVLSRQTTLWSSVIVVGFLGIMQAMLNVAIGPLLLRVTPQNMVGRVEGILNPIILLGQVIGITASGTLASTVLVGLHIEIFGQSIGSIDAIFIGAGLMIGIGAIYATVSLREPAAEENSSITDTVEIA